MVCSGSKTCTEIMWRGDGTEKYVIYAKVGKGISTYQFDSKDYALEVIEKLKADGTKFTTNFDE